MLWDQPGVAVCALELGTVRTRSNPPQVSIHVDAQRRAILFEC